MSPIRTVSSSADEAGAESSAEELFDLVWCTLAESLGTAAVAAIVRRASRRAVVKSPELAELVVTRDGLDYRWSVPAAWCQRSDRAPVALRELATEIGKLLLELTGSVVVRRLEQTPGLRTRGLVWRPEEAN